MDLKPTGRSLDDCIWDAVARLDERDGPLAHLETEIVLQIASKLVERAAFDLAHQLPGGDLQDLLVIVTEIDGFREHVAALTEHHDRVPARLC